MFRSDVVTGSVGGGVAEMLTVVSILQGRLHALNLRVGVRRGRGYEPLAK